MKNDLAGKRFGRLVAVGPVAVDAGGNAIWLCKCDCGTEVEVRRQHLIQGTTQSCGCYKRELNHSKAIDITGQVFGRLRAVEFAHYGQDGNPFWRCQCSCGKEVIVRKANLQAGTTQSCGCLALEKLKKRATRHGGKGTRLYKTWNNIKDRCLNPNSQHWQYYGARGITICQEWIDSFEVFRDWALNNNYQDHLSIDRINNSKGYSPENCRWATSLEQGANKRNNHKITYNGETKTLMQWVRTLDIAKTTLMRRLAQNNGDMEAALKQPYNVRRNKSKNIGGSDNVK